MSTQLGAEKEVYPVFPVFFPPIPGRPGGASRISLLPSRGGRITESPGRNMYEGMVEVAPDE